MDTGGSHCPISNGTLICDQHWKSRSWFLEHLAATPLNFFNSGGPTDDILLLPYETGVSWNAATTVRGDIPKLRRAFADIQVVQTLARPQRTRFHEPFGRCDFAFFCAKLLSKAFMRKALRGQSEAGFHRGRRPLRQCPLTP